MAKSWKDNRLVKFFYESKSELEKVNWPSRKETVDSTLVVLGVSLGVAAFLGALDYGFNFLLGLLISR